MNACTDILLTVLKGHYVAAACKEVGIDNANSLPPTDTLPNFQQMPAREQYSFIMKLASQVLERCGIVECALIGELVIDGEHAVANYARVFCHHGSLALEFMDA